MAMTTRLARRPRGRRVVRAAALTLVAAIGLGIAWLLGSGRADSGARAAAHSQIFGPNVYIFSPRMPPSRIQATVDSIARRQIGNQFGDQRYALLFEPGMYGSAA